MTNLRLPIDGVFCFMEIWKDIPNYEGIYQVSSLGRVKSLGNDKKKKEKILKHTIAKNGYYQLVLRKDLKLKTFNVHQLVAMAFLNHVPCGHKLVVDHINDIKTDNRIENLQIITQRENSYKTQGKYSSKYRGVCWNRFANKWVSHITINGKLKRLGAFNNEEDASQAYQKTLKEILQCNS